MGELLPDFWAPREDDPQGNCEAKTSWARLVQDIFMGIQCFGTYVSVLPPPPPSRMHSRALDIPSHDHCCKSGLHRVGLGLL